MYSQDRPQCFRVGPWQRDARTVTFALCGHEFPIPKKPTAPARGCLRADDEHGPPPRPGAPEICRAPVRQEPFLPP